MIGVVAKAEERDIAQEFFELFKTPWEFCRPDERYEVVLDTSGAGHHHRAKLVIVYGSTATAFDHERRSLPGPHRRNVALSYNGQCLPVYGDCLTFSADQTSPSLVLEDTQQPVAVVTHSDGRIVVRVGYDLFGEVGFLLTTGQPPEHARVPALDRHIAFVRDCVIDAGIPLVEIPPIPAGHRFIACLTHDVDHPFIRAHKFDHTMFGFLYRAVVGSLVAVCRRRESPAALRQNLAAALGLPLVHLGWIEDFWAGFDRYVEIERGRPSTFFVIPARNQPGRTPDGEAPRRRASAYDVSDVAPQLTRVLAAGSEVALHGIDAWLDSADASEEREIIARATGTEALGVRMHWLFWTEETPARLDKAGFSYDSTFGYNSTVGFRAGTSQAFKPIAARHLLELPLTIMDTALFYPAYLGLTQEGAKHFVDPLVDEAERYGGALTINWHDRSLAPERLWNRFYLDFLTDLDRRSAWFATAGQATAWFRHRRSAVFSAARGVGDSTHVTASAEAAGDLPGLNLRVHTPAPAIGAHRHSRPDTPRRFADIAFRDRVDVRVGS